MNQYTKANFERSALITIDTQCDTLDGQPFEIPGTSAVLPNIRRVLDAYRIARRPIVHIVRIYKKDASNVELCRKETIENGTELLLENTPGCELAPAMFDDPIRLDFGLLLSGDIQKVNEFEVVMYKPRWGAFYNTRLESYLKSLGVDTVVFTGCNFPNCPRTSIYEASERDFKIVLVDDAISGLYVKGKQEMQNIGVQIRSSEGIGNATVA